MRYLRVLIGLLIAVQLIACQRSEALTSLGNFGISSGDSIPERQSESFNYVLESGKTINDSLRILNTDSISHIFDLSSYAANISSTNQFSCGTSQVDTIGSWLVLDKPSIKLAANSSSVVSVKISVPDNSLPGEHNFCIIANYGDKASASGSTNNISLSTRIVLRVSITVPGEFDWQLKLSKPKVMTDSKHVSIVVPQTNTGRASLRTKISINYVMSVSKTSHSESTGFIMPGATGSTTLTNLPKPFWGGFYKAVVRAEYLPSDVGLANTLQPKTVSIGFWYIVWPCGWAYLIYISAVALMVSIIIWLKKQKYRYKYRLHR